MRTANGLVPRKMPRYEMVERRRFHVRERVQHSRSESRIEIQVSVPLEELDALKHRAANPRLVIDPKLPSPITGIAVCGLPFGEPFAPVGHPLLPHFYFNKQRLTARPLIKLDEEVRWIDVAATVTRSKWDLSRLRDNRNDLRIQEPDSDEITLQARLVRNALTAEGQHS